MPTLGIPPLQPEEWLTQRLENIVEFNPRFEASWYGPYNALLSHYFPYQQRFLIKPQPKVREPLPMAPSISFYSGNHEPNSAANNSMTSTGELAVPGGSTFVPDFIVAKATKSASNDQTLLLVEVKVRKAGDESTMETYEYQMDRYMDLVAQQMQDDAKLVGLLICGTEVSIFRLDGPGCRIRLDGLRYDINSAVIRRLLQRVAKENWD